MPDVSVVLSSIGSVVTSPTTLLIILLGTTMGLIFGSLPGLTATMGVALLIPLTYTLEPVQAIGMMLGCYVGGIAGGAIPACLLNIPGTPDACVTTLDGYPMAQKDREQKRWGGRLSPPGSVLFSVGSFWCSRRRFLPVFVSSLVLRNIARWPSLGYLLLLLYPGSRWSKVLSPVFWVWGFHLLV